MNLVDSIVFIFTLGLLILSGSLQVKRVTNEEEYLFANRKSSFFALTCTLVMTEFNTSTLISFSGLGYIAGVRALLMPCIFLIGLLFYTLVVSSKWKSSNASSVSEVFTKKYSKGLGRLSSIFLLVAMCGFNATYIKSLSMMFAPLIPNTPIYVIAFIFNILTTLMCLRGGLFAIIRTDIVSFCLLVITLPIVCLICFFKAKANPAEIFAMTSFQETSGILPFKFILSLTLLTMFTYILAPWYGQKIFSARSKKVAFFSCLSSAAIVFILYGICTLSTMFIKKSGLSLHEMSYPFLVKEFMPIGLRGLCYSVLFAASATTLSGAYSAMTSMVLNDFFSLKKYGSINRSMLITLGFSIIAYFLGIFVVDNILNKLILSNIPVFALSYALLAAFYYKKASSLSAYVSIFVGLFWGVFCYLNYGEENLYTWKWATWGLLLIFGSGYLTSLIPVKRKMAEIS